MNIKEERRQKKEYLVKYLLSLSDESTSHSHENVQLRAEIEAEINSVEEPILVELLYHKYVFGKTLEDISYILNYSSRHIERLHIKALDAFDINYCK